MPMMSGDHFIDAKVRIQFKLLLTFISLFPRSRWIREEMEVLTFFVLQGGNGPDHQPAGTGEVPPRGEEEEEVGVLQEGSEGRGGGAGQTRGDF